MTARRTASDPSAADPTAMASRLRLSATRLARQLRQNASTGLTPTQLSALASVDRRGPLPLRELAEHERVAPPTITAVVGKLEAAGLLRRTTSTRDRRSSLVAITDEGRALLDENRLRRDAWLAVRIEALPATQRTRLAAALDVLDALIEDEP